MKAYKLSPVFIHKQSKKLLVAGITAIFIAALSLAFHASATPNPSVSIDQCDNGGVGNPPVSCDNPGNPNNHWGSGNLTSSKAHWKEGDVLPYRAVLHNLNPGVNTVTFSFDTAKSSELKHAIDYLASYDHTETTGAPSGSHANMIDPCGDVFSCTPSSPTATAPITVPSYFTDTYPASCANGTFAGSALSGQSINAWSAAAGGVSAMSLTYPDGAMPTSGDCTPSFKITFTVAAGTSDVVIAWGGHVAANLNPGSGGYWGAGNAIPTGSPYHMHAGFDQESPLGHFYNVGSQDLQLASSAIVNADAPAVNTAIHNGSNHTADVQGTTIALGSTIHDKATLDNTGGANGTPMGTATFSYFTNGTCTLPAADTSSAIPLVSGLVDATGFAKGPLAPGSYSFKAHYTSSDATKWLDADGLCESVTVGQGTSTVTTTLHKVDHSVVIVGGSVPLGTVMHDLATVTVTPTFAAPSGNINFTFYATNDCSDNGTAAGTVALNGANPGVAHPSSSTAALTPGSYGFKATWAGDTNYTGNTSTCERFTVSQSQLSMESKVHDAVHTDVTNTAIALGSVVHDTAKLSSGVVGGFTPAPITFTFWSNGTCNSNGTSIANTGADQGDATRDRSDASAALGAGSYSYKAFVASDTNYLGSDSGCEPFSVSQAQLGIGTTVHSDSPDQALAGDLALNAGAHDLATVTGKVGSLTLPDVTFYFFAKGVACSNGDTTGATPLNTVSPDGSGVAHPSTSETNLAAGNYNFMAVVGGNANYIGTTSACEPFTVDKASTNTVTHIHNPAHDVVTAVPLGTSVHDNATIGDQVGGFTIGGTVTYTFFTLSNCSTGGDTPETVAFGNESSATGPLNAGSYSYQAVYSGDVNYIGSTGACEPLTVNKADLGISTTIHDSNHNPVTSVSLGSVVHDTAAVTGQVGSIVPTGAVTFQFFTSNDCSTGGSGVANVGADGGAVRSANSSSLAAGNYSYNSSVASDDNYNGKTSDCEPLTVNQSQLSMESKVHNDAHTDITNTAIALGSVVHDTAKLSGGVVGGFTPPAITFKFFTNGTCTDGTSVSNAGADQGDATRDRSDASAALGAGSYSYKAFVAGDSNYIGSDSGCEPFSVNKTQLGITTAAHDAAHTDITNGHVPLGSVAHDTANVSGAVEGFALPAVSFTLTTSYSDSCASGDAVANNGTEGGATKSADSSALGAGTYAYRAVVADSVNYTGATSACEPFTVDKAQLTVTTQPHDSQDNDITNFGVSLGSVVHDQADLSGKVGSFDAPAITFTFYTGNNCVPENGTAVNNTGSDPKGGVRSADSSPLPAGNYSYKGSVTGNNNYLGDDSDCEPFTITPVDTTTVTHVHDKNHTDITNTLVALGSVVHDNSTVGAQVGSFVITGNVTYHFYHNGTCTGDHSDQTVAVGTESDATSALGAGSYSYLAEYGGDSNYNNSIGTCEPFSVNKADLRISTDIHDPNHVVITSADAGSTVHDSATVSGLVNGFDPANSVTFTFYRNGNCTTGTPESAGSHAIVSGVADPSDSKGPLAAGSYAFKAHYAADGNYNEATSGCELLTVNLVTPTINTTPNPASGTVGVVLNDSAVLGAGFNPGGNITFKLFGPADATCAGTPAFTNVVSVNGDGTYNTSSGFASNASGTWRWIAVYGGDGSNNSVSSGCSDEQVTITAPPVTRTLGFWQTHLTFTTSTFNSANTGYWLICNGSNLGERTISNVPELMGGFWANIAKKSDNKTKRTDLDQARMQLIQQLLAAMLNKQAFGSDPGGTVLADAKNAFCGTNKTTILNFASVLDAFNQSGDNNSTNLNVGKADPKGAKNIANIPAWNTLP